VDEDEPKALPNLDYKEKFGIPFKKLNNSLINNLEKVYIYY